MYDTAAYAITTCVAYPIPEGTDGVRMGNFRKMTHMQHMQHVAEITQLASVCFVKQILLNDLYIRCPSVT